jgi:Zn-dependent peptidase ImmA (M78 family)
LEPQANSFAGLVLVPPSLLEEKFTEVLQRVPPDLQRNANTGEIIDALASFLAPEFGVSQTTMQIRIGRQGLRPN